MKSNSILAVSRSRLLELSGLKAEEALRRLSRRGMIPCSVRPAAGGNEIWLFDDGSCRPDRTDRFSWLGLARDLKDGPKPLPFSAETSLECSSEPEAPQTLVDSPADCPFYAVRTLEASGPAAAPQNMAALLRACDVKADDAYEAAAGLVQLEIGQLVRFYDADLLKGRLRVRRARAGEALDGPDPYGRLLLSPDDIVVADDLGPVSLAGLMGGLRAKPGPRTRRLVVECGRYDGTRLRRTARRLDVFAHAAQTCGGCPPLSAAQAGLDQACRLAMGFTAAVAGPPRVVLAPAAPARRFVIAPSSLAARLGLPQAAVERSISRLCGPETRRRGRRWSVTAAAHRPDATGTAAIAEEALLAAAQDAGTVARAPRPWRRRRAVPIPGELVRTALAAHGAWEVVPQDAAPPEQALSEDEAAPGVEHAPQPLVLRPSLLGGLLEALRRRVAPDGAPVFSVGRVYARRKASVQESEHAAAAALGPDSTDTVYALAAAALGARAGRALPPAPGWGKGGRALLAGRTTLGRFGPVSASALARRGLPGPAAAFEALSQPKKKSGRRAFLSIALIPLLAALSAAQTDELLERAENLLHELEGGSKGCEKEFSVERMIQEFSKTGIPPQAAPYINQEGMADIIMYSICKSYSLKDPSPCDELEVFKGGFDFHSRWAPEPIALAEDCRISYYEARMVKAKIKGEPGVQELCEKQENISREGDRDFKPEFLTQACRVMHESSGTAKEICRRLEPFLEDSSESFLCENNLLFMSGDAEVCRRLSAFSQPRCQGYAAFKKAAPSGNPALCGNLPICRVMMEQAGACRPFTEKIKRGFCGLRLKADYVKARRETLAGLLDEVGLKLSGSAAARGGKEREDLERRRKKMTELRARALRQKKLGP